MSCENTDLIAFGQEFIDSDSGEHRVVVDPEQKRTASGISIGAAGVGTMEISGEEVESLGLSGTINLHYLGQVIDHWSLDRIKTAHSRLYSDSVLPRSLEEIFDAYSKKPPSKRP